jgi:U4/U6.U5 tri-snRNP-associated protein 3
MAYLLRSLNIDTPSASTSQHGPSTREPSHGGEEEGEEMDAENEDDAAMMAMMGIGGFGTTKVCISPRIP